MEVSGQDWHSFVDLIYEAAEQPEKWREFFEKLRRHTGVKSIHMLALDKQHGSLSYSEGANLPLEGELAYMHHYRLIDPRFGLIAPLREGEWLDCPQALEPGLDDTHPLYQEFLIPYDRRYNSMCKLVDQPEATIVFSLLSGDAEGPPSKARDFVDGLMPHLQRACRLGLRNFVHSTQALVGQLLVEKLRQPVILMSPGGEVMHTNQAAQALLRSTSLVQVVDGRLQLPPPCLKDLLRRCGDIEKSLKQGDEDAVAAAAQFRSLRISRSDDESVYAFFTLLAPEREGGAFGLRPVVMLMFYHPASAPGIDADLLYAVFGLSPAECRIASLLAEGLSLKEIAQALGRQHETVRKQLRSIYQKTSTNRQPELIRLLLHLPQNGERP